MEGGHHKHLPARHVHSLDELCRRTKFSRKEIQLMYRSFKQECPNGYVEEDTFRLIFSHFFPHGNVNPYAHYVFRTFDQNKCGAITFKDFLECVSVMSRGSLHEKLEWTFRLYDLNGDGRVTKKELADIMCAVYALMTRKASQAEERAIREHVDKAFSKMDINKDGVVTIDEFMEICSKKCYRNLVEQIPTSGNRKDVIAQSMLVGLNFAHNFNAILQIVNRLQCGYKVCTTKVICKDETISKSLTLFDTVL